MGWVIPDGRSCAAPRAATPQAALPARPRTSARAAQTTTHINPLATAVRDALRCEPERDPLLAGLEVVVGPVVLERERIDRVVGAVVRVLDEAADDRHVLQRVVHVHHGHGRAAGAPQVRRPGAALGAVEDDLVVAVEVAPDDDGLDRAVVPGHGDMAE